MNKRTLQSLILGIAIGRAAGLGVYTFVYAKGASYLMNNPASCANCYIRSFPLGCFGRHPTACSWLWSGGVVGGLCRLANPCTVLGDLFTGVSKAATAVAEIAERMECGES
jgi:hypothetical protein